MLAGTLTNIGLRATILYFLGETLLFPNDPRFAGKAIAPRNLIFVIIFSIVIPALYQLSKRWKRYPFKKWPHYPWWLDNLYLSTVWLDMFGNSFNLYDRFFYFDLFPHFYTSGAVAILLIEIFKLPLLSGIGLANILHILIEGQEYYTDVLAGTHNVRGTFDTVDDLLVGVLGSILFALIYRWLKRKKIAEAT